MQNHPLFYKLIELYEVPWQKNWVLPVFCFSLLLACTWGIICSWKWERKEASHTTITSHKLILLQFPIIFMHPVLTLKSDRYWWGRVEKNLETTRIPTPGSQDRQVQVWQPGVTTFTVCANTFSHFCAPIPGSVVWAPAKEGFGDPVPPPNSPGKCLSPFPVPAQEVGSWWEFLCALQSVCASISDWHPGWIIRICCVRKCRLLCVQMRHELP